MYLSASDQVCYTNQDIGGKWEKSRMSIKDDIRELADRYAAALKAKLEERVEDMLSDDTSTI